MSKRTRRVRIADRAATISHQPTVTAATRHIRYRSRGVGVDDRTAIVPHQPADLANRDRRRKPHPAIHIFLPYLDCDIAHFRILRFLTISAPMALSL